MSGIRAGLVDVVRDFLRAHRSMRGVFERFQDGVLAFEDIEDLVGDGESCLLFRLKERCHTLFRSDRDDSRRVTPRESIFDLAVGSLFHEAMKFRENLYQTQIYGPKVQRLRSAAGADADTGELFDDFEKILRAAHLRLEEALEESEALLAHTAAQLRLLLIDHREDGLILRYLVENPELVSEVFGTDIETLLDEMYGDAQRGFLLAARSYLTSAHFEAAMAVMEKARASAGDSPDIERLAAYARGMQAFLEGSYDTSLKDLGRWVDARPGASESAYAELAFNAISRIANLVAKRDRRRLGAAARRLARRIEPLVGGAAPPSGVS